MNAKLLGMFSNVELDIRQTSATTGWTSSWVTSYDALLSSHSTNISTNWTYDWTTSWTTNYTTYWTSYPTTSQLLSRSTSATFNKTTYWHSSFSTSWTSTYSAYVPITNPNNYGDYTRANSIIGTYRFQLGRYPEYAGFMYWYQGSVANADLSTAIKTASNQAVSSGGYSSYQAMYNSEFCNGYTFVGGAYNTTPYCSIPASRSTSNYTSQSTVVTSSWTTQWTSTTYLASVPMQRATSAVESQTYTLSTSRETTKTTDTYNVLTNNTSIDTSGTTLWNTNYTNI